MRNSSFEVSQLFNMGINYLTWTEVLLLGRHCIECLSYSCFRACPTRPNTALCTYFSPFNNAVINDSSIIQPHHIMQMPHTLLTNHNITPSTTHVHSDQLFMFSTHFTLCSIEVFSYISKVFLS